MDWWHFISNGLSPSLFPGHPLSLSLLRFVFHIPLSHYDGVRLEQAAWEWKLRVRPTKKIYLPYPSQRAGQWSSRDYSIRPTVRCDVNTPRLRPVEIPRLWRKDIGTAVLPRVTPTRTPITTFTAATSVEVDTSEVKQQGEAAPVMVAVPHTPDHAWAGRGSRDTKNSRR